MHIRLMDVKLRLLGIYPQQSFLFLRWTKVQTDRGADRPRDCIVHCTPRCVKANARVLNFCPGT